MVRQRLPAGQGDGRGRGWDVPDGGQVALLLAVWTAMPELTGVVTPVAGTGPRSMREAVSAAAVPEGAAELHARLSRWLDAHPRWADADLSALGRWTEVVQRFAFARPGA